MVLLTLAGTGDSPTASNVGNVISDPEPTMVLTAPAARPAAATASAPSGVTGPGLSRPAAPGSASSAGRRPGTTGSQSPAPTFGVSVASAKPAWRHAASPPSSSRTSR